MTTPDTIAGMILGALWVLFWIYWLVSAFGAKRSVPNRGYWRRQLGIRLLVIVLLVVLLRAHAFRHFARDGERLAFDPVLQDAGVFVAALGMAFAVWARVNLGANWGVPMTMRAEPELVKTGPYRLVRHPIYTGILFALLGTAPVVGGVWIVAFVLCGIYFVFSAIQEEKLMTREFPEQYPEYRKHTKMFIPYVV